VDACINSPRFWLTILLVLCAVAVATGCATVTANEPMCSTDGRPNLPDIETRFVGLELTVACYITPDKPQVAVLKIRSSEWIWTALAGFGTALVGAMFADADPPLAPNLWPEERGKLEPAPEPRKPHPTGTLAYRPMGPLALACGGILQHDWCPSAHPH
jgi:hypothetical protein